MIAQICSFAKKVVPLLAKSNNLNMIETNRIEFKLELTRDHDLEQLINKHIMRNGSLEGTENLEKMKNPKRMGT
jgi:hypothetical protein